MEEPVGAQYAVHIAMHTLKDRCRILQQRVANLEQENLSLQVKCIHDEEQQHNSISEIDALKAEVTELSEQKQQLINKIKMVTSENQQLWTKLSRLTHANQNLGTQLNKISESIVNHTSASENEPHSPLIRSKTFTQNEPHTKILQRNLEENTRICSELEEISLKIINTFAQGKNELDSLYSDINDIQCSDNVISESCGFYYEDLDNNVLEEFNTILKEFQALKSVVFSQNSSLHRALDKINRLEMRKQNCDKKISKQIEVFDQSTQSEIEEELTSADLSLEPQDSLKDNDSEPVVAMDKVCPICCSNFSSETSFPDFQTHVESHFTEEDYELL